MNVGEPRWWWTPARELTEWSLRRSVFRGSDEYARATIAIWLPPGMLVVALWRFRGWSGPCARCGQWDPAEEWVAPYCTTCHMELIDHDNGCICPSFLDERFTMDDPWPVLGCAVHAHLLTSETTS